ncbi:NLP/P60 family protein [Lachnospiraceae bacterium KM106-2]|nr:NLP/P60 family protein [Lachnospiraceae bacterium KM106-2]
MKNYLIKLSICLVASMLFVTSANASTTTEDKTQATARASQYDDLAMGTASSLNIRESASTSAKIIGKLAKGAVGTVIEKKGGWVKLKSGSVTGYASAEYLAIGSEAEKLFDTYAKNTATVTATSLNVRKSASTSSSKIGSVAKGTKHVVLSQSKGFAKIKYNSTYGYISTDYVTIARAFTYATKVATSSKTTGQDVADYAVQFVGNPYKWGGTSLTNGADCSGFTQSVYKKFGITIPRTSKTQATAGTKISVSNRKAGDLLFYREDGVVNHVALYIGNNKIVHASSTRDGIKISNYNYRTVYTVRRFIN